jgi:hypothetical protein
VSKAKDKKVKAATQRSLERALLEERLAIAAIVKVMLIEVPDPARVLARLDAMTRAAEQNPRVPPTVRRQLIDATRFVRTAIQREQAKPQELFDPHVGHVSPKDVNALVAPTDGPQQLGLVNHGSTLGDVEAAHEDRVRTISTVHAALVGLLREKGAMTDRELFTRYLIANAEGALPRQTQKAITERRRELVAAGRVVTAGRGDRGEPAWDILERDLITPGGTT